MVPWNYVLYKHEGSYFISVTCGTSANFDTNIQLSESEIAAFQANSDWLNWFAEKVRLNPKLFNDRHIAKIPLER